MSTKHKITSYIKEKVIGKHLHTAELVYTLEDGALEGVYSDNIIFSNLTENTWGFNFDMFIISNEKIYEVNENRERSKLHTDFDGVSVFRFELAERKSTNQLTGIFRLLTTSTEHQTAQGIVTGIYNLKLKDNRLSWSEEQCLYRDQPNGNDTYGSIAFHSESSFYFEEEKLIFDYNGTCFNIDPVTFSRSPSKSIYPSFIAKEG